MTWISGTHSPVSFSNFGNLTWQMVVMWGIGALLIYLAIAKK